jgi:hypothetical protein
MINSLREKLKYIYHRVHSKWNYDTHKLLISVGKLHTERIKKYKSLNTLIEAEFQVFSQWGEDGIIQYIINQIDIPNKIFVEFGVENYLEANTRFLLINDNWSGLVIDGSKENIKFIHKDYIYWKYDLTAIHSFITKDNINQLIQQNIDTVDIGLLSIDIDGNDYWIWNEINYIKPRIVVCEYNSVFGNQKYVTTPYKKDFVRGNAHHSDLYFGASLPAFCQLAEYKGYDFIGTNSSGINAFFVRKDLSGPFKKFTTLDGYTASKHRESRDNTGKLSFVRGESRIELIKEMNVWDIETNSLIKIKDLYNLV